jgi:4'-phosphopantetheinyl transferase
MQTTAIEYARVGEPRHTIAMILAASRLAPGDVGVWYARAADLTVDAARTARARDWLTPDEQGRHDRYHADVDRAMFLAGRVMARALVGRALDVAPTAWTWHEGPRGRPGVAGANESLAFNIAHSGGTVVCAVRRDGEVGVDVESRDRRAIDPRLVARYCAPDEARDIEQHGPDGWRDRFLQYWTLKEAYLKARGLGIAVPLASLSFRLDPDPVRLTCLNSLAGESAEWTFALRELPGRMFLAVAAPSNGPGRLRVIVEPFPGEWWP